MPVPTVVAILAREVSGLSADWRVVESMPPSANRETDPQPVRSLEFHRVEDTHWRTDAAWHEETGRNIPARAAAFAMEYGARVPDPIRHRSGAWTGRRCSPTCNGWAVYNGSEIQRCDECDRFRSDGGAAQHVTLAHQRLIRAARLALYSGDEGKAKRALRAALKLATGEA